MTQIPRYLEKWESSDAAISYTFPLHRYEYESRQPLAGNRVRVAGANYSWDAAGHNAGVKEDGMEVVRFLVKSATALALDDSIDELRSKIQLGAQGKIWVKNQNNERRWAYARPSEMPAVTLRVGDRVTAPVAIGFTRTSDWYDTTVAAGTATINTAGTTVINIVNAGNIPAQRGTLRFRSGAAVGWVDPLQVLNLNNGYQFTTHRGGSSIDDDLLVNITAYRVGYSENNGASYIADYANFERGSGQAAFMQWEPGTNVVRIIHNGGTPNLQVEWSFDQPFA